MVPAADDPQLAALRQMLGDRAGALLFPCVKDLVTHGLDVERFEQGQSHPNRQDVTMYLAAWLKHAGLTTDIFCTSWFTGYCEAKLAAISSSSPSQVRHSARSSLKYVLGADIPFACRRADNPFRAHCTTACPHHAVANQPMVRTPAPPSVPAPPVVPEKKKATFAAQFAEAMKVARTEIGQGKTREGVVALLNERGFKTRTGREWTAAILRAELLKQDAGADPRGADGRP